MKTMKDFKGTQGDFEMNYPFLNSDQLFVTTGRMPMLHVAEVKAPEEWTKEEAEANARLFANSKRVLAELIHLVRLLEPLEKEGKLDVPGLATLNGAIQAINDSL